MVNFVVDDKIVIKCHQPEITVLANLDVAKFLFEFTDDELLEMESKL